MTPTPSSGGLLERAASSIASLRASLHAPLRPSSRAWLRRTVRLAALAPIALAACDLGGPSGPATVMGTVTGDPELGGAVVELAWDGITSFDGRGSTRAYFAPVAGSSGRHRIVLVDATGGELRFTISLADERLYAPAVEVVSAVGTDNLPLPVRDLRVVLER